MSRKLTIISLLMIGFKVAATTAHVDFVKNPIEENSFDGFSTLTTVSEENENYTLNEAAEISTSAVSPTNIITYNLSNFLTSYERFDANSYAKRTSTYVFKIS